MTLSEILVQHDVPEKKFQEHEFPYKISQCDESEHETLAFRAEKMAFSVEERYLDDSSTGKKYFSYEPILKAICADGTEIPCADIKDITPEMIEYWEKRITATCNPILKARYAGLVWEFKKEVTGAKPDITVAVAHIQSLIEIVNGGYFDLFMFNLNKLERAIVLSKILKQEELLQQSKEILRSITENDIDEHIGVWASPFRISMEHPKTYSEREQAALVISLQARFDRIANESLANPTEHKPDPWLLMQLADALSGYYNAYGNKDIIPDLYRKVKASFDAISMNLSKLQLVGNLSRLHERYLKYLPKNEVNALNLQIAEAGKNIQNEMQVIPFQFNISKEEIESHINSILADDIEPTFGAFAFSFIPQLDRDRANLMEISKTNPFASMFSTLNFDESGRVTSHIGSLEQDMGGKLVSYISMRMKIDSIFMNATIQEGKRRGIITIDNIMHFLRRSPSIKESRFPIIERGLRAYFEEDYLTSIHVLIPQIEAAIRNMVEVVGLPTRKPSRNGDAFDLRLLDDLLRDEDVQQLLTLNFSNYLRILLTDNRGWNLRNEVCHGIPEADFFNRMTADRLIHILLCLGVFRYVETDKESKTKMV